MLFHRDDKHLAGPGVLPHRSGMCNPLLKSARATDRERWKSSQTPLLLLRLGTISSSPPERRHLRESCGSVCMYSRAAYTTSLAHTHTCTMALAFCRTQILQESLAKPAEGISHRQCAGQNITQSVHPRGLQLDPKYLNEDPGVLITSDCRKWPPAAQG